MYASVNLRYLQAAIFGIHTVAQLSDLLAYETYLFLISKECLNNDCKTHPKL